MPSIFDDIAGDILAVTNEVMGVPCLYTPLSGDAVEDVMIIINKNKKVTDEFKNLVGFRNEANFLKAQYPIRPNDGDKFTTAEGVEWRVGTITIETNTKWYVDVRES